MTKFLLEANMYEIDRDQYCPGYNAYQGCCHFGCLGCYGNFNDSRPSGCPLTEIPELDPKDFEFTVTGLTGDESNFQELLEIQNQKYRKHKVKKDIHLILKESGIPSEHWEKVLNKLTNYATARSFSIMIESGSMTLYGIYDRVVGSDTCTECKVDSSHREIFTWRIRWD